MVVRAAATSRHVGGADGKRRRFSSRRKLDYASFKKYMTLVFAYAGTYSLERELQKVPRQDIQIGDVFIRGGFPGVVVLVADMVANPATGEKRFLLIQSFMPAQEMHVLKNPAASDGSPWYPADFTGGLAIRLRRELVERAGQVQESAVLFELARLGG